MQPQVLNAKGGEAMATIVYPISALRNEATLSASVSRSRSLPFPVRAVLKVWLFPRVLGAITDRLSGDQLGRLTSQQAKELYDPLAQLYDELNRVLHNPARSRFIRVAFKPWFQSVEARTERLGEIVETLAWASDDDLKSFVSSALEELGHPA
jgi:hypothetical protein